MSQFVKIWDDERDDVVTFVRRDSIEFVNVQDSTTLTIRTIDGKSYTMTCNDEAHQSDLLESIVGVLGTNFYGTKT